MGNVTQGLQRLLVYKQPIADMVARVLNDVRDDLPILSEHATWALDTLSEYSARDSKRVRGSLAAALYDDTTSQDFSEAGLRLAAAIELVQNYLLIVDDVMDRSTTRRGQPTVHELYKSAYPDREAHEADMIGVLVGMIAQHASNIAMLSIKTETRDVNEALRIIQQHTLVTCIGQIDDVQQVYGRDFTREDLLRKYQQKSSYYSFVSPLLAALTLAGAGGEQATADCESFGLPAGVAFQLRDDYLGLFGDMAETGKPNCDDIREGKHTLMIDYALGKASANERQKLRGIMGNPDASDGDLVVVQEIVRRTNALDKSDADMRAYADRATSSAREAVSWRREFGDMLGDLVNFSITREK